MGTKRLALGLIGVALMLASCGDNASDSEPSAAPSRTKGAEASEAGSPAGDASAVCESAETIAKLDDQSQGAINDFLTTVSAQPDKAAARKAFEKGIVGIQRMLTKETPELLAAYDKLESDLPPELQSDVATVKDFTVRLSETFAEFKTLEEFSHLGDRMAELGAVEAGQAVLAVDKYTRDECGVTLAD